MKKILQKILLNSWTISIVLGLIVFILIPFHPDPYKIRSSLEDQIDKVSQAILYADLDGDNAEEIILSNLLPEKRKVEHVVSRMNRSVIDQYNIENVDQILSTKPYCGDYNSDGYSEIYTVFLRGNDLMLKVFCPLDSESELHEKEIHIYTIPPIENAVLDVETKACQLFDMTGDGSKEFFVILFGKYQYWPHRRVFKVDLETGGVTMSPS